MITKETIEKGLKPTLVTSAGADAVEPDELAEESAAAGGLRSGAIR